VSVQAGITTQVTFTATCESLTGDLSVSTVTTGEDLDEDGYTISVDAMLEQPVASNGEVTFEALVRGDHSVELTDIADNCTVAEANPQTVTVPGSGAATAAFTVTCGATTGGIRSEIQTTGPEPDSDGYTVLLDGGSARSANVNDTVTYSNVAPGDHDVELIDVADNCAVGDTNPRVVTVVAGETVTALFEVTCASTIGDLIVAASTTGEELDADGYVASIDGGASSGRVDVNGEVRFENLSAGDHQVELLDVAPNCAVFGQSPRTVTVISDEAVTTTFTLECSPTVGEIRVSSQTSGTDLDPDGYVAEIDGGLRTTRIGVNDETGFGHLDPGDHQVELTDVASNCTVSDQNPRTVTVTAGQTTSTLFSVSCSTAADDLQTVLDSIRAAYGIPALAAVTVHEGDVLEMAAAGRRAIGYPEQATEDDLWHVGSLTKAMTATLVAVLVERGVVSWDATVGQVLPDLVGSIREEFVDVRLDELLYHTAGLVVSISRAPSWPSLFTDQSPIIEQRRRFAAELLALPPDSERGTYRYTNAGYIVAGAMLEEITGESWEVLVEREVFNPLGMRSMGFGSPGSSGSRDQPWGHTGSAGNYRPVYGDNPAACGPAGTVHTTLADYSHFMVEHLAGTRGQGVLASAQAFEKLHTPAPGSNYAMGWVEGQRSWANGRVLTHNGSNNLWYAVVWLAPERELGFFAVTNAADTAARSATNEAIAVLIQRFEAAQGSGQASAVAAGRAALALEVE
jgi:CubicO group peptidase (beta-lactamase class C family)